MPVQVITGNHAAGYALSVAGEANRTARGVACGIYPITPQTEIVEYVAQFPFSKGRVVPVESEHSAMAVSMGASMNGARAFTASSANGLAYMAENVMVAGYYRLPIVMVAVNRTLGPPWNIWADQGDTLMLRDFAWLQFYCEDNQEVLDTTLLAFRLAEDRRILLPALTCMDAFIVSHTQTGTALPEQADVDRFLPDLDLPHRMHYDEARTLGGLAWPHEGLSMRLEIDEAMKRVADVYQECRESFTEIFGRDPGDVIQTFATDDAKLVLVASGTIATTAREVVRQRRKAGEKIGLVKLKMFRPFPEAALREACQAATRVAVLDRNYAAGAGGIFWQDTRAAFQGHRDDLLIQNYLTGLCGGDVTPTVIDEILADLTARANAGDPVWMGIQTSKETLQ
ncbi:MAG: pyruvate ferredoxin oxidoreductase [Gammaproteobacteria bacterium]|nr:pyruvate ferredoxin oxidoreductase [Gammaproteobacteria bacterium]MDH3373867.1 pyruvate ferredoxin oxidoreductase [Gammaproteobacteria bacterium]MDH3408409.1 pyruvate ferredoxin oxidoreductase [Gammaproteobacteria bacterium]